MSDRESADTQSGPEVDTMESVDDYDPQVGRNLPVAADPATPQSVAEDQDFLSALQGLAGLVADVDDLDDVLVPIAGLALVSVPGADGAGVTVMQATDGAPKVLAWSVTKPFVRTIDQLQYEICHEGPCLTAMRTGRPLTSGSLGSDGRWPRFGGRVARLNVHSALAIPLIVRDVVVGALNIYARERDAFGDRAVHLGVQFARPAAVSVRNVRTLHAARVQATQLQTALGSRAVIDQAIGIVRSRSGGTADEAFDRLRQISQAENVRLAIVAARVVDEAVRRANARHTRS